MNRFLRKNAAFFIWLVVLSFAIGGSLFGFGVYLSNANGNNRGTSNPSNVVAKVNKEPISYEDYYEGLRTIAQNLNSLTSQKQILAYQYQVVDSLIDSRLLLQEAKKQKIKVKVTEDDANKYIADIQIRSQMTDEQFVEALAQQGLDLETLRKELVKDSKFEEQIIINTLMEKITGEIIVSEQDVKDNYEQVHVNNITINKGENAEEAKAKAEKALAELKNGHDFSKIALMYSDDPNAENGADLGFFSRTDENSKVLADAAFAVEVGQVTEVVETADAYNILKVIEVKLAEGPEFEEEKDKIKEDLFTSKKSEIQSEWFKNLKDNASVTIYLPELAAYSALIKQDYATAIDKFEEAITKSGGNDAFYAYLAIAHNAIGEKENAINDLNKAIEIAPTSYELYMSLGSLYQDSDEKEKAVEQYQKASENAGDEYMVHFYLQQYFVQLGRVDLAQEEQKLLNEIYERSQAENVVEQAATEN